MKHLLVRAHQSISWIVLGGTITQFFLAGLGVFSAPDFFGWHAMLGAGLGLACLLNVGLAFACRPLLKQTALYAGLMILQGTLVHLVDVSPIIAALHPVNGLALLYVAYGLARAPRPAAEAAPTAARPLDMPVAR